jgi:Tol biopolymer transport system component
MTVRIGILLAAITCLLCAGIFGVMAAAAALPPETLAYVSDPDANRTQVSRDVYFIDLRTRATLRLTAGTAFDGSPVWSPDGCSIAYATDVNITIVRFDGTRESARITFSVPDLSTTTGDNIQRVSWSPDGQRMVFSLAIGWLYVLNVDDLTYRRITGEDVRILTPDWSPDGSRIVYDLQRGTGRFDIFTMNPDGSDARILMQHEASEVYPVWSPDGSQIAFCSNRTGSHDIYVADADGGSPRQLTTNPADDCEPDWSPDGTRIAFTSDRGGSYEVYVMNHDGSSVRRITHHPRGISYMPDWRPRVCDG